MSHAIVSTKRIGGSIMVRLPKELVEAEGLRENDLVDIEVSRHRKDYFGAFPQLKPWSKEDKGTSKYD